jgi:myo-inositol 2-dehydrogenase/D-chiro-inositol 1-dehydrogenase
MRIGLAGVGRIGAQHARALHTHPDVDELVVTDADPARAAQVAADLGVEHVQGTQALLGASLDAFVIAAATDAHAELILAGIDAGLPVFCEKPVSGDVKGTVQVRDRVADTDARVHIGFQRRFDVGYVAAREALASGTVGELRRVHLITGDQSPPPAAYIATSGGAYRDMHIHDFDILRWVTGREVVEVYATGVARGADYFATAGDVSESAALLTLDDGTLCTLQGSRYNGGGHDVRMEVAGTSATWAVGLDDRTALHSAEPGASFPAGPPAQGFWPRFEDAYRAEMTAFVAMARGEAPSACTVAEALEALYVAEAADLSRREHRPVRLEEVRA